MGKLVTVIGNSGSGKTLLTRLLCEAGPFRPCLEQHHDRPFQRLFMQDTAGYALPNQVDYLMLRAEQEYAARQTDGVYIQDGGLDLDFYLYTRYFHRIGYLSAEQLGLCERLHDLLRSLLPVPELIIMLDASEPVLAQRRAQRNRAIDISRSEDLAVMQALLGDWTSSLDRNPRSGSSILHIDSAGDIGFSRHLPGLIARIRTLESA